MSTNKGIIIINLSGKVPSRLFWHRGFCLLSSFRQIYWGEFDLVHHDNSMKNILKPKVSTVKNKWVVKDNFKRWWQVKVLFFMSFVSTLVFIPVVDTVLWWHAEPEDWRKAVSSKPSQVAKKASGPFWWGIYSSWSYLVIAIYSLQNEELRTGLTRARETIDMKYMEKWRRCSL